jgi:hypothetical protein
MVQVIDRGPSFGGNLGQALGNLGGGLIAGQFENRRQEKEQQRQQQNRQQEASHLQSIFQKAEQGSDPQSLAQAIFAAPISPEMKKLGIDYLQNQQKMQLSQQKESNRQSSLSSILGLGQPGQQQVQPQGQQNGTQPQQQAPQFDPSKFTDAQIAAVAIHDPQYAKVLQAQKDASERRENERSKAQEKKLAAVRSETAPVRKEIADKARIAVESIKNKEQLLDIIDRGNLNDPTFAATLEALPFNYGKRLLHPDTVEYKAGLIEEFGDLKNIFQGQTRISEIKLFEQKLADLYLTDEQKKRILKARVKAEESHLARAEAAAEVEQEHPDFGVLKFSKEVERRTKEKQRILANQVFDDIKNTLNEAQTIKERTLDFDNPEDYALGVQILREAKNDIQKAIKIAERKGYKFPKE